MDKSPSSTNSMPYPELVTGDAAQRYQIFDTLRMPWLPTNGMTDKEGRRIFTPFHPDYRYVSRHELAHVKWSPEKVPKLDFDGRVYLAVEDARINMGLAELGSALVLSDADREYVAELVRSDQARGDVGALVLRSLAGIGTNAAGDTVAAVTGEQTSAFVQEITTRVRERLSAGVARRSAPVASPELAVELAREIAELLGKRGALPHGEPGQQVIGCVFGSCAHADEGLLVDGMLGPGNGMGLGNGIESGRLEIREAPLSIQVRNPRGRGGRKWRPAPEGCVLAYPHRIAFDGAVYRRALRRAGCTILIDASGSMRLTPDDLVSILAAAPGKPLVALYGGDGDAGELRIVARHGMRATADSLAPPGVGNIVDIPCLEWLSKQAGPRIWVSDGRVTGVGDQGSAALRRQAVRLCHRANIHRVENASEAVAWLQRR